MLVVLQCQVACGMDPRAIHFCSDTNGANGVLSFWCLFGTRNGRGESLEKNDFPFITHLSFCGALQKGC